MFPRLLLVVGLLALTGCRNKNEGAVKLTVSYSGFKPGCLRVSVKDAEGSGEEERTTEFNPSKGDAKGGGTVTVAAYREAGWSNSLTVKAEAFEKACTTESAPVATVTKTVPVDKDRIAEETLALEARDEDGDGYVSDTRTGGHDCNDAEAGVNPDAQELCNGRDDNCDKKQDEGFEVGELCDAPDSCHGAWACGPQGARICTVKQGQWHPDGDNDGQGAQGPGITACKQPAGYVANDFDCDDTNPRRNTKAAELCNAVDDNCDGDKDEGLGVGALCSGEGGCEGTNACATDGSVMCNSPKPTMLYADSDKDTHGAADAGVMNCGPTRTGYVSSSDDCDDTRANVYTGAKELCDGLDNNCNTQEDEGFNLEASCDPGLGCSGVTACATDGGTQCAYVTPPSNYYPDEDLDQHGKADAGVLTCAPDAGYIAQAGDCNDGNPFTHANAAEICDREDNDCDGNPEAPGVCPSNPPVWNSTTLGDNSKAWYTVGQWGDGGVWIAGEDGRRARKRPGETTFTYQNGNCAADWYSLWIDDSTGRVYLGGGAGKLGIQDRDSDSCTVGPPSAGDSVTRGLVGKTLAGGGVEMLGVGFNGANGRVFGWDGGVANQTATNVDGLPFFDVHGLATTPIFLVGGPVETPRIVQHIPPADWREVQVPTMDTDGLNAVWVVNPKLAFAVGENRTVLQWNGQIWSKHPVELDKATLDEDLHGVIAFGGNSLYVVSKKGNVFYFNGKTWEKTHTVPGKELNDITGTGPDNLWVVGTGGAISHWPK